MNPSRESLSARITLDSAGPDRYIGHAPASPERVYGGEVAAQALAAANATVAEGRSPHALHCTYLAAGDPSADLEYDVHRVRDGRSMSSRAVSVHNAGKLVLTASVGYHVPEDGVKHQHSMPAVPSPDHVDDIADAPGTSWMPWAVADPDLEMRTVTPVNRELGRQQFWLRLRHTGPDHALEQAVLASYGVDFTMVSSMRLPHEPPTEKAFDMTTLSLAVHFHRPYRASEWNLFDHWSPVVASGRGLAIGHVYTAGGELVLTAIQEALIRPRRST
jgi:acyl-CoA thioesterase II